MGTIEPTAEGDGRLRDNERARRLILTYGWNSTVYQILNPGMRHWFSAQGDALVGYVQHAGARVVAGAPVARWARLAAVAREFEEQARREGLVTCYFMAESRWLQFDGGRPAALVGAQPVWPAVEWEATVARHESLRAQLNRARNKDVTVERWSPTRLLAGEPGSAALRTCLQRWTDAHGLPPLGFLTSTDPVPASALRDFAGLRDRRLFVALRRGEPIGYLLACPVPLRGGWLFEQVVRDPSAPNGSAELLIDFAARDLAGIGANRLTLGLSPLSRLHRPETARRTVEPAWQRLMFGWAYAHGRRFYDFAGLEAFKEKFWPPIWEPLYLIGSERHIGLRMLYAVASAFTAGRPLSALLSGIRRGYLRRA